MPTRKYIKVIVCFFAFFLVFFPIKNVFAADTISVKLVNYIGNRSSLNFETQGSFKLSNNNSRFSGANRFEVANSVADAGWSNNASTVVVVNYLAFADALSSAPLAYKNNAPILLVEPNSIPTSVEAKIKQLSPTKIIIVGGTSSISTDVETKLKKMAGTVERISGIDRFEVASKVADQLGSTNGKAIVTNGLGFADALAIAPYAAKNGIPILLTANDFLPDSTKSALTTINSTIVIGGEGSVSPNVYAQLTNAMRIGGSNRYEVSANIVQQLNMNAQTVFLSSGQTFADALTGSVLAAKQDAPLLLTDPKQLPDSIKKIITDNKTSIVNILGGPASVSDQVVNSLPNEYIIEPGIKHTISVESGKLVLYKNGKKVKDFADGSVVLKSTYNPSNQFKLSGSTEQAYLGTMQFNLEGQYIRPYNLNIPFEDYLKGVVPREMPASWGLNGGMEALKAQAVAARTYSYRDKGNTVLDSQSYQVYGGYNWDSSSSTAVDATKGQVLRYNGNLISAVFSSSNGGFTATNYDVWGSPKLPYLDNKPDPYDTRMKWSIPIAKKQIDLTGKDLKNYSSWWTNTSEVNADLASNLKNWLSTKGYTNSNIKIVEIKSFNVDPAKDAAQRSISASLTFDFFVNGVTDSSGQLVRKTETINQSVDAYRSLFGIANFKSTLLDPVTTNDNQIIINGRGYGHGVGMSQYGAYYRSQAGQTYNQILMFYYPNTTLGN